MLKLLSSSLALSTMLLWVGCPGPVSQTKPEEVVSKHLEAAREGKRQEASIWLSFEARQRGYRWPQPHDVPRGQPREVRRMATWKLPSGQRVDVQRKGGGWKIHGGILSLSSANTPQQTVLVLARAIASRDYGAMIRLMPMPERSRWSAKRLSTVFEGPAIEAAWSELARAIRTRQDPVEVVWVVPGRRARVVVPMPRHTAHIELVAQDQVWKVLDVTPRRLYTPAR